MQLTSAERDYVHNAHEYAVQLARRDAASSPDAPDLALGVPAAARAEQLLGALMTAMAIAA